MYHAMARSRLFWWLISAGLFAPVTLAFGSDGSADQSHGGGGGDPNIFSGGWGTAIFTLAIFVVLMMILAKWAWGPILAGLKKREEHIRQSIADAEKARSDAESSLTDYRNQLASAADEAESIIEKGRADAQELAEQLKQQSLDEAKSLREQAGRDIGAAKEQALKELCDQAAELSCDLAGRIIKKSLDPQDHRDLLAESLNQLQNSQQDS